jgi:hypothetical protein
VRGGGIPLHRYSGFIYKVISQNRRKFEDSIVVTDATNASIFVIANAVIRAAIDTAEIGDRLRVVRIKVAYRERILAVDQVVPIA